ncbi:MAG: hypothetical protein JNL25_08155 [Rhodospirillaceae bacterium]|nr:hypothetical protein [Rhodospirillaceae bacterium]
MALPPRPRPFAERPQSALPSAGPANDNRRETRDRANFGRGLRGRLQGHAFRFASPEAEEQWIRDAYQAGINADTWHLGDEIDDRSAELALAGLGGPMPAVYLGPDGKYRTINPRTIEAALVRDHRNRHLTGKTIDQIATAGKMPGEQEWIAQWRANRAANDNALSRGSAGQKEESPSEGEGGDRPDLGTRFAASARRAVVDDTVFGNALQQFASGHAVSPDVLATRPSDRFQQLGSKGMLEWHRMFEPLGIAGGKRRIDFLSPKERKHWETAWEALPASQQAVYRAMWEEKQKDYRPWREKFERETALPPPETVAEFATDIAGSIAGSMASPESWIGFTPKTPLHTMRAAAADTIGTAASRAAKVVNNRRLSGRAGSARGYDPHNLLPNANTRRLTEKDVYALTGDDRGFAFVLETPRGKPDSIAWEEAVRGRYKDIETHKTLSPGILYRNSNKNGLHVVKFDGYELADDGELLFVIDAKRRFPFFFNAGAERDTTSTILRWTEALQQNPDLGIMIEFPNSVEMFLARKALRQILSASNRIYARVRNNEQ